MVRGAPDYSPTATLTNTNELVIGTLLEAAVDGDVVVTDGDPDTASNAHPTSGRLAKDTSTSPATYYFGNGSSWEPVETGLILRQLSAAPTAYHHKSVDPGNQTYSSGTETVLETYDAGEFGAILPLNFNPADPTDADLNVVLRAEFHNGDTQDLATVADGTAQTFENLVDGFASGNDGKGVRKLLVIVDETGDADATEDIGASVTRFMTFPRGNGSVTVS